MKLKLVVDNTKKRKINYGYVLVCGIAIMQAITVGFFIYLGVK